MTNIFDKTKETQAETKVGGVNVAAGVGIAGASADYENGILKVQGNLGPLLGGVTFDLSRGLPTITSTTVGEGVIVGLKIGSFGAAGYVKATNTYATDGTTETGRIQFHLDVNGNDIVDTNAEVTGDPRLNGQKDRELQKIINASYDPAAGVRIPREVQDAQRNGYTPDQMMAGLQVPGGLDAMAVGRSPLDNPYGDMSGQPVGAGQNGPYDNGGGSGSIFHGNDAGAGAPYGGEFGNAGYGNNGLDTNGPNPYGNDGGRDRQDGTTGSSGGIAGGDARMGDASGSDTTGFNASNVPNYNDPSQNYNDPGNYSTNPNTTPNYNDPTQNYNDPGNYSTNPNTTPNYNDPAQNYNDPGNYSTDPSTTSNTSSGINNTSEDDRPVLLDLSGHGINIAELTRSTKFLDANGSGLSHRTAWAGAGTGVLFYDPGSTGQITSKNQYVFTEWDKTAKGDLEALLNVFDSNGDGKLDASDAKFSLFKVMVTNADGTTTAHTLTELGITAINLKADLTHITYADGSAITGETTFTKADGSTGTVANTSLAYDGNGRAVTTTSSTDASGTVSVTSTGLNSDGSIAFIDTSSTSADGSAITNTYDHNGDGVMDHIQLITTSTDALGTRTETITNTNGGHVLLDRIQTISSSDGSTVTINRDTTGGGWSAVNDNLGRVRWMA